jgi:hypothetical protein
VTPAMPSFEGLAVILYLVVCSLIVFVVVVNLSNRVELGDAGIYANAQCGLVE